MNANLNKLIRKNPFNINILEKISDNNEKFIEHQDKKILKENINELINIIKNTNKSISIPINENEKNFLKNIEEYISKEYRDKNEKILVLSAIIIYFQYINDLFFNDYKSDLDKIDSQQLMRYEHQYIDITRLLRSIIDQQCMLYFLPKDKPSFLKRIILKLSSSKKEGGNKYNNNEFINYKYKDKTYKRKLRYDGKKAYIIINKKKIYMKK